MKIEDIKKILLRAKERNKIQNSYIIYGGREEERKDIAIFLSGVLNCEKNFCKECEICRRIITNTHPDLKFIVPEKNILSINEVREVKNDIFTKPYYNRYKIYIFEIEYIKEEASSAFLKIIEEPPEYGILIILTPNINFLLPTIISRCSKIYINYNIPRHKEEFEKNRKEFIEFIELIRNKKFWDFFKKVDTFCKGKEREEIENWIESIIFFLRDFFFYNKNFPKELLINKNFQMVENIKEIDIQIMEKIWEIKQRIKYNVNLKLAIETLLFLFYIKNSTTDINSRVEV